MSQGDVEFLPGGNLRKKNSQRYHGTYAFFLASNELQENTNLKQRRYNRKKIRLVAMVLFVTALLFGIYAAYSGTIVFNEVGTAVG